MSEERHIKPFGEWLQEQRRGACHTDLSEAFNDLIDAVMEHGKGGDLVLTVKVKPAGSGEVTVFVPDEVKDKRPEGDRPAALFFVDDNRNLTRHDPRQMRFPLREVPTAPPAVPADTKKAPSA